MTILPMFTCAQCGDEYEPSWEAPEGFCSQECAEDYAFGVESS